MIYKVCMYIETCCEQCNEPVHAHFNCPYCNTEHYNGFNFINDSFYDEIKKGDIISCEDCGNKFKIIKYRMNSKFILEDYKD